MERHQQLTCAVLSYTADEEITREMLNQAYGRRPRIGPVAREFKIDEMHTRCVDNVHFLAMRFRPRQSVDNMRKLLIHLRQSSGINMEPYVFPGLDKFMYMGVAALWSPQGTILRNIISEGGPPHRHSFFARPNMNIRHRNSVLYDGPLPRNRRAAVPVPGLEFPAIIAPEPVAPIAHAEPDNINLMYADPGHDSDDNGEIPPRQEPADLVIPPEPEVAAQEEYRPADPAYSPASPVVPRIVRPSDEDMREMEAIFSQHDPDLRRRQNAEVMYRDAEPPVPQRMLAIPISEMEPVAPRRMLAIPISEIRRPPSVEGSVSRQTSPVSSFSSEASSLAWNPIDNPMHALAMLQTRVSHLEAAVRTLGGDV
jgi:hypothetical protein